MEASEEVNDSERIEFEKKKGICSCNYRCSRGNFSKLGKIEGISVSSLFVTHCPPLDCKYAMSYGYWFLCSSRFVSISLGNIRNDIDNLILSHRIIKCQPF